MVASKQAAFCCDCGVQFEHFQCGQQLIERVPLWAFSHPHVKFCNADSADKYAVW